MTKEPVGEISDRLYTKIPYTAEDLALFQTPEMTQLRRVSLSATA